MAIEWSDELAVGVPEIDAQHQELIRRVRRLLRAEADHSATEEVLDVAEFLQDYVVTHFTTEERAMIEHAYPGREEHVALHAEFTADLARLIAQVEAEGVTPLLVVEAQRRIVEWLFHHVRDVDRRLGAYLAERL